MLSVASRCFGQVDACDSKREYLCSIVGFMHPFRLRSSDINVWEDVLLPLGRKQRYHCLRIFVLLTLRTLLNEIICCLQLNNQGCSDDILRVDY